MFLCLPPFASPPLAGSPWSIGETGDIAVQALFRRALSPFERSDEAWVIRWLMQSPVCVAPTTTTAAIAAWDKRLMWSPVVSGPPPPPIRPPPTRPPTPTTTCLSHWQLLW
ncbi:hypothetical protein JB92DRAFT_3118080 [Gautieria morchelliformis]|nr:hypothetical protein JB92DRAFT_3118080 [Gautieria morchelliformis]